VLWGETESDLTFLLFFHYEYGKPVLALLYCTHTIKYVYVDGVYGLRISGLTPGNHFPASLSSISRGNFITQLMIMISILQSQSTSREVKRSYLSAKIISKERSFGFRTVELGAWSMKQEQ
jgi:hypothetical protein